MAGDNLPIDDPQGHADGSTNLPQKEALEFFTKYKRLLTILESWARAHLGVLALYPYRPTTGNFVDEISEVEFQEIKERMLDLFSKIHLSDGEKPLGFTDDPALEEECLIDENELVADSRWKKIGSFFMRFLKWSVEPPEEDLLERTKSSYKSLKESFTQFLSEEVDKTKKRMSKKEEDKIDSQDTSKFEVQWVHVTHKLLMCYLAFKVLGALLKSWDLVSFGKSELDGSSEEERSVLLRNRIEYLKTTIVLALILVAETKETLFSSETFDESMILFTDEVKQKRKTGDSKQSKETAEDPLMDNMTSFGFRMLLVPVGRNKEGVLYWWQPSYPASEVPNKPEDGCLVWHQEGKPFRTLIPVKLALNSERDTLLAVRDERTGSEVKRTVFWKRPMSQITKKRSESDSKQTTVMQARCIYTHTPDMRFIPREIERKVPVSRVPYVDDPSGRPEKASGEESGDSFRWTPEFDMQSVSSEKKPTSGEESSDSVRWTPEIDQSDMQSVSSEKKPTSGEESSDSFPWTPEIDMQSVSSGKKATSEEESADSFQTPQTEGKSARATEDTDDQIEKKKPRLDLD